MYELNVDQIYIEDLHDDFVMNYDYDLYQFIGRDPIRAFWLAVNITDWFTELEKDQKYLYSKQIRHNKEYIEDYQTQFEYWTNKFQPDSNVEISVLELSEFILNNMFWNKKEDIIYMAFWLGQLLYKESQTEKLPILQLDKNNNIIKEWDSIDAITTNYDKKAIIKCCEGQQGSHKGYIWRYKND